MQDDDESLSNSSSSVSAPLQSNRSLLPTSGRNNSTPPPPLPPRRTASRRREQQEYVNDYSRRRKIQAQMALDQQQEAVQVKKKKSSFLFVLFIALLAALISAFVYYWNKKRIEDQQKALAEADKKQEDNMEKLIEKAAPVGKVSTLVASMAELGGGNSDKSLTILPPTYEKVIGTIGEDRYYKDDESDYYAPPELKGTVVGSIVGEHISTSSSKPPIDPKVAVLIAAAQKANEENKAEVAANADTIAADIEENARLDVDSVRFCGETGWRYMAPAPGNTVGTCYRQCDLGEDFLLWRLPNQSAFAYQCRKRCPKRLAADGKTWVSTQDQQGFCDRRIENPRWYLDGPGRTEANDIADCGHEGSYKHYGRFCYNVGKIKAHAGGFTKHPMNCPPGWKQTPSKLSCYQCSRPDMILKGSEDNGYLCVEKCPKGSSDAETGSTNACYLEATALSEVPGKWKPAIIRAPKPDEVTLPDFILPKPATPPADDKTSPPGDDKTKEITDALKKLLG